MHAHRSTWAVTLVTALALTLLPAVALAQEDRSGLEHACPEGDVPDSGFTDTTANTHEHAIDCAAWWGITQGGPAGRPSTEYGPEMEVRRDQMASFVTRMIDESDGAPLPPYDGMNRYDDVDDDNVHVAAINRLANAGIVTGRTDTEYAPAMIVRRDQMASFIARAIRHVTGVDRASDNDHFRDVEEDNPHRRNINGLYEEGVVRGFALDIYAPANPVRRDAMAAFVMRGMDLHVDEGDATPPAPNGEDPDEPPDETPEETPEEDDCPIAPLPCEPPFP
jgi:hypothetical protein